VRSVLAAVAAALLLAGCAGDDDPTAFPTATPTEPLWNPCEALDVAEVGAWFDATFTQDAGTPSAPVCTFTPAAEGGPALDANYMLFPEGLDAVFETMTELDPEDVRDVRVPRADTARIVVDFDNRQLFVSGFVQNDDLIQTVDVVDPLPYDEARVVRAVRSILVRFSAAAPRRLLKNPSGYAPR
jgi:hypothetical protein